MKKRYPEEEVIRRQEAGTKADDICQAPNISKGTFYSRCSKYVGLEVCEAKRLKDREVENN